MRVTVKPIRRRYGRGVGEASPGCVDGGCSGGNRLRCAALPARNFNACTRPTRRRQKHHRRLRRRRLLPARLTTRSNHPRPNRRLIQQHKMERKNNPNPTPNPRKSHQHNPNRPTNPKRHRPLQRPKMARQTRRRVSAVCLDWRRQSRLLGWFVGIDIARNYRRPIAIT